ncbi:MFS general substrate transporter [Hortaea werneckii]|nr:MFS general substrate transporter [Hortaea werneckii]KAI6942892.1 MFS general substrate transporter [Hortaea werneckii]KAI6960298.1 MFS general substrate transporter [Hortaea werneckii]KAI6995849.1 MFS general substrate transporter [Hortaea werneckii]KAI7047899.1 MFS general substrate transporter [Hortaea werneckii]
MAGEGKTANSRFALSTTVEEDPATGYVLDADKTTTDDGSLKIAKDGHTILVPQPSENPNDPLNWPSWKKHAVLLTISFAWHMSKATIQESVAINTMLSGVSGIAVIALSNYFGRAPTFFWMKIVACAGAIWYAKAQSFDSFYNARMLVGFFVGAGQTGGLMWIRDIFFLHEIPRKINIWSGFIIASPYLGPFMASFVVWGLTWRWVYWIYAILNYVGLLLIILFADETFFDRRLPANQQPAWRSRPLRLVGVERHGTYNMIESCCRPFVAIFKLPVLIITVFYFLNFAWTIGVNATLATWLAKFYHFDGRQTGLFYFAPIVGCIIGAISGHWLHDLFARWYMSRHSGTMHPEARLYIIYFASGIVGLFILLLGQALQHTWHFMAVAVFDAAQLIGVNIISTAVNAYLGDAYPEAPGEMDTWIVMGRTMGGFMATYIELPWVQRAGPGTALGAQAGITWAALVLMIILQVWGKDLRNWQGPIKIPGQT